MLKQLSLRMIRRYQANGGSQHYFNTQCNFEPSCSEYTHQAITRYGLVKGAKLGWNRIRRCNDPDCPHVKYDPLG